MVRGLKMVDLDTVSEHMGDMLTFASMLGWIYPDLIATIENSHSGTSLCWCVFWSSDIDLNHRCVE